MKRIFSIALVAVLALFTACNNDEDAATATANFKLTSPNQYEVAADGGSVVITYSIANTISGASVKTIVTNGESAVKSVTNPYSGIVLVEFYPNNTSTTRIVIIRATYGDESFDVVFSQKPGGSSSGVFDVECEATSIFGYYYGQKYGEGSDRYAFYLSDRGFNNQGQAYPNGSYYYIDAFAPVTNSSSVPTGTYTLTATATGEPYTLVGANCQLIETGASTEDTKSTKYTDARMVVTSNGITLELTIAGKRHKVVYSGSLACQNVSDSGSGGDDNEYDPTDGQDGEPQSTLTTDHHVTFDGEYRAKWVYEGDYWKTGYSNYTIMLMNKYNGTVYGDTLQFDLITDNTSKDGQFAGKYTIAKNPGKMVMVAGFTDSQARAVGCWLFDYIGVERYANYAMIKSGSVEIIDNGDGTQTVKLNGYDYLQNNITCNWTGVIEKSNM